MGFSILRVLSILCGIAQESKRKLSCVYSLMGHRICGPQDAMLVSSVVGMIYHWQYCHCQHEHYCNQNRYVVHYLLPFVQSPRP